MLSYKSYPLARQENLKGVGSQVLISPALLTGLIFGGLLLNDRGDTKLEEQVMSNLVDLGRQTPVHDSPSVRVLGLRTTRTGGARSRPFLQYFLFTLAADVVSFIWAHLDCQCTHAWM